MYEKLKSIFKQTPEFLIVHISTNDTSKYTPNKIVDTCQLQKYVIDATTSQNENGKVFISTLKVCADSLKSRNAVQKATEILKKLNNTTCKKF